MSLNKQVASATGSCRCGQTAFEVHAKPLITTACHCTGCQKMSSSAFSLTALVPVDSFVVIRGKPVIGGLHGASRHYFCPQCLSWLFTRPAETNAVLGVRSTMLDKVPQQAPFMETWTSEKLPWAVTGAAHSFAKLPDPQAYGMLIARFAQRVELGDSQA